MPYQTVLPILNRYQNKLPEIHRLTNHILCIKYVFQRVICVPVTFFHKPMGGFMKRKTRDGLPVGG